MLIGIIIGLLIATVVILTYLLIKKPDATEDKEDEQQKRIDEHWDKILNYTAAQAYGGKE